MDSKLPGAPEPTPNQPAAQADSPPRAPAHDHTHDTAPRGRALAGLALGALGVVYGDIGTSPLYALRECFHIDRGVAVTPANIIGILSLFFWALTIVVTWKYLQYVMRADNHGEGGILALMALVASQKRRRGTATLVVLGLFGSALLYSDGMLTPAISVVSAANTAMQLIVADHMRGRVLSVRIMLFTLSFPVGSLIQGWVSDQVGPRATVLAAAGLMLAVGLILALRQNGRVLARLDDPHDELRPETPNSTLRHNGWSFDPPGSTLRRDPSHPRSETQ